MNRSHTARRACHQRGFTLVECIVTLFLATVLLGIGVPSFQKMVTAQRLRAASFDLISDLTLARSEALKRRAAVQLLPSDSGWSGGWRVEAAAGTLARRDATGVSFTTAPAQITFGGDGRVVTTDSVVRIGITGGQGRRCISLDPAGRPKSVSVECPA